MSSTFAAASLALLLFLIAAAPLRPQQDAAAQATAHLGGRVVDGRRLPVPGAEVRARGAGTSAATRSGADGTFTFDLKPGVYTVSVRKAGYQNAEAADVALLAAIRRSSKSRSPRRRHRTCA